MNIKILIIMIIGAAVIGMSIITVPAEEINRINEVSNEDILIEEENSEEPVLISPNPNSEPLEEESEISLISEAESKNSDILKNSNTPIILILGIVGFLIILLLVINRKK